MIARPSKRTLALGLLLTALAFPASLAGRAPGEDPLAVEIGEQKVTLGELILYLRQSRPGLTFERLPASERKRLVEDFVERKLFGLRAREDRLQAEPEVRARIAFFTDGVLGQAVKERALEGLAVSEAEARAYHQDHRDEFRSAPRFLLTHLLYLRPESAEWARGRLAKGAPFEELARDRGKDPNLRLAEQRWFTPDLLIPELAAAAEGLAAGEVRAVETDHGHHLLRLEEREPARHEEFSEVWPRAEEKVRQAKASRLYQQLLEEARARHPVRVHLDLEP